jgi:hypothetical protein
MHKYLRAIVYLLVLVVLIQAPFQAELMIDAWDYLNSPFQKAMGYITILILFVGIVVVPIVFSIPHVIIDERGVQIRQLTGLRLVEWNAIKTVKFQHMVGTGFADDVLLISSLISNRTDAEKIFESKGVEVID